MCVCVFRGREGISVNCGSVIGSRGEFLHIYKKDQKGGRVVGGEVGGSPSLEDCSMPAGPSGFGEKPGSCTRPASLGP